MVTEQEVISKCLQHIHPDIIKYAFDKKTTPIIASELTKNVNLDTDLFFFSSMLAEIGIRDGFDGFRPDIVPRLRGMYRFSIVRNADNRRKYADIFHALEDNGISYICGYYLSLKTGYTQRSMLVSDGCFDIVVHRRHYKKAVHILNDIKGNLSVDVKVCGCRYVWKNAIAVSDYDTTIRILSPTSLLLLYSDSILFSMVNDDMYCVDVLFDRMRWLYYYKVIASFPEPIDYRALSKRSFDIGRSAIRFILEYAYGYFGEESGKTMLEKYFVHDDSYQSLLERMDRR